MIGSNYCADRSVMVGGKVRDDSLDGVPYWQPVGKKFPLVSATVPPKPPRFDTWYWRPCAWVCPRSVPGKVVLLCPGGDRPHSTDTVPLLMGTVRSTL